MQKKNGFTLIELMVAIAILGIIATIAAPSFENLIIKQNLKSTSYHMRDILKEAKSRAILNRNETIVCISPITESQCKGKLTNSASLTASLVKDSVFIIDMKNKVNLKELSADHIVFTPRGNLNSTKQVIFCSSVGSYVLSISIPGIIDISEGAAC
ncbi:hypothetical protein F899_02898 [Acinetobacter sp. CIP 101934]|mgnify:CR=1 FL=1|jgi:type IV fimbrial biogenesis protein FimT|uniref:prepilin-type N-terminal cleavage/methylation domain-containing protein n=1 Tax=Acinetobacter sp. CIP 101934 TaxID=1144661 RepID=UPI0002CF00FA|nr:prepilin-type N-terminal cleavage/methylation domain-containing protein [Acinetobacter sp. CIP 101934]ENW99196.1 hypothetical protein F899_02898 [Acinetobacter sp. CIP 101934]